MILVRVQHLAEMNLCVRAAQIWFARNGLDFAVFMREGLPVEQFDGTDALGALIATAAREDDDGF